MSVSHQPSAATNSEAIHELLATIEGPLLHDFQGALGVIRLATQLLREGTEDVAVRSSHDKILNACRRLSWRIEDLKAQLMVRLDPAREVPVDPGTNWVNVVRSRIDELSQDHPRRKFSLEVTGQPQATLALSHLLLIVTGLVDAAVRTTAADQAVFVTLTGDPSQGLVLSVRAEGSRPSTAFESQLGTPPVSWLMPEEGDIPFRLIQAALLARKWGGDLQVFVLDGDILARAQLPARASERR